MEITFWKARPKDLAILQEFTDYWLSGRGRKYGEKNCTNDYFITASMHLNNIKRKMTVLAYRGHELVGWAAMTKAGCLNYMLISGRYRGQGIGRKMLELLRPNLIHSKTNQQSGDPTPFYEKNGFYVDPAIKVPKRPHIAVMENPNVPRETPEELAKRFEDFEGQY